MSHLIRAAIVALIFGAGLINFASAATQSNEDAPQIVDKKPENAAEIFARSQPGSLVGKAVTSPQGKELGTTTEIVRGKENGKFHVVISRGSFLGLFEGTEVVVPLSASDLRDGELVLLSKKAEGRIKKAEEYRAFEYGSVGSAS